MEPREEPEGRPGGPGDLRTARGAVPPSSFTSPGPPGRPSGSSLGRKAQGPGIGAKGADAEKVWGGQSPPHQVSPIMVTLRALGPKGPKISYYRTLFNKKDWPQDKVVLIGRIKTTWMVLIRPIKRI